MRLTIARTVTVCTLLLWMIVFPLATLRIIMQIPNLYLRWIHDGDVYRKLGQAVTIVILRRIPGDVWSPWINRHPDVIHNLFNHAVNQDTFETLIPQYMICWTQWLLGGRGQPCLIVHELEAAIDAAQWELVRAYLWETLPSCFEASPPSCRPMQKTDYAEYGTVQSDWWAAYRTELIQWAKTLEEEAVSALSGTHISIKAYNWTVFIASFLTFLTLILVESQKRLAYLSILFLVMCGSALTIGISLALGLVRYKYVSILTGVNTSGVIDVLMPQIWPMLAHLLGMTLILIACLICIPALAGLLALAPQHSLRFILVVSVIALLSLAYLVLPETIFVRASPLPAIEPIATPTPWPTFTLTPTLMPTRTPPPPLSVWPVSEGTPLPPPVDVWWQDPKILRCFTLDKAPLEVIKVVKDELWVIQNDMHHRFYFSQIDRLAKAKLPRAYDHFILSPSGNYAALAEGRDVWFYTLSDWEPVISSRVSTLAPIESILFTQNESFAVLGLENGYVWVSDVQTGELVTLFSAYQTSVTALANYTEDGFIYSGAADGTIQLWDYRGQPLKSFSGHTEEIQAIVPLPYALELITLDVSGRFILWEETSSDILGERTVASPPTSNLVWLEGITDNAKTDVSSSGGFIVGGTMNGQVFMLDRYFTYQVLMKFDSPISVISAVDADYLIVGMANGQFCIVGKPQ